MFGEDDGVPYGLSPDIVAHEFAHRMLRVTADYEPDGEAAAVHESVGDTIAAALDDDWTVGEDIQAGGLRTMAERRTISSWVPGSEEHAGAAIANSAAYEIGTALGREAMGRIYVEAIESTIEPNIGFRGLATATWRAAVELYGADSVEAATVRRAWDGVLELGGDGSLFTLAPHPIEQQPDPEGVPGIEVPPVLTSPP